MKTIKTKGNQMRTKLTKPHRKDCMAMRSVKEKEWDTPWYFPNGFMGIEGITFRDKLGRNPGRGRGEEWIVFRCNSCRANPCSAEMIVALNDILSKVPTE